MSNNDGGGNQRRNNIVTGVSLLVGSVGVAVGALAAEHVHAQEENRDSILDNMTRWVRTNILDTPDASAARSTDGSSSSSSVHYHHHHHQQYYQHPSQRQQQQQQQPREYPQHRNYPAGLPVPQPLRRALTRAEVNVLPVRRVSASEAGTVSDMQHVAVTGDDIDGTGTSTVAVEGGGDGEATGMRQRRKDTAEESEKAFCVVCRESYQTGDELMRLPCFHEFHVECIREYLETTEGPLCPICRHPVTVS